MEAKFNNCPSVLIPHFAEVVADLQAENCDPDQAVAALRESFEPIGYTVAFTGSAIGVANSDGLEIVTITFDPIYTVCLTSDEADAVAHVARQFIRGADETDPHAHSIASRLRSILTNLDNAPASVR